MTGPGRLAILARMDPLSIETLRTIAKSQGLDLSDAELGGLLPLVQAGHALMQSLEAVALDDVEPTSQYRMF